jgi:hypothetical protein
MDLHERRRAVDQFRQCAGSIAAAAPARIGNLHAHTFYSYNVYGYSPSRLAVLARQQAWEVAGIVDFDVVDGVMEFHEAGRLLNLRTVANLETRVHVPAFQDRVINSPGEPGIAYQLAVGFARRPPDIVSSSFLNLLCNRATERNREIVDRLNRHLAPLSVNFAEDVLPLTPNGNVTERHLVLAYARKAQRTLLAHDRLQAFWSAMLGPGLEAGDMPESDKLLQRIRAVLMKKGGPGYMAPTADSFPELHDFNSFAIACGAIPAVAWRDGMSAGEQAMEEWASVSGAHMLNIVPARNFTPGAPDEKLRNLYDVVDLARQLRWPVLAGTEMNSPGQAVCDDYTVEELRPIAPVVQRGAFIAYAHTALQRFGHMGYLGNWADRNLPDRDDRNDFFAEFGRALSPRLESHLNNIGPHCSPDDLLRLIT